MENYQVKNAVVLVFFNRYEHALKVFEQVRKVKPPKLYLVADGPRNEVNGEAERCERVRSIYERIDWDCQVFKNYSEKNLGCGLRLYSGFSWVFESEESAIILEDDCLPHLTFFRFCDELLEMYKNDERIWLIGGSNLNTSWNRNGASYFFAKYGSIHGWATWRRSWEKMDLQIKKWRNDEVKRLLKQNLEPKYFYYLKSVYDKYVNFEGKLNAWGYQFGFAQYTNYALDIVPSVNLITNIGFGQESTNTRSTNSKAANIPLLPMEFPLRHPECVLPDLEYDKFVIDALMPFSLKGFLKRQLVRCKEMIEAK